MNDKLGMFLRVWLRGMLGYEKHEQNKQNTVYCNWGALFLLAVPTLRNGQQSRLTVLVVK